MKPTKTPKRVDITRQKIVETSYISEYQCPCCRTIFRGGGPASNVLRFKCRCGQELIINSVRIIE